MIIGCTDSGSQEPKNSGEIAKSPKIFDIMARRMACRREARVSGINKKNQINQYEHLFKFDCQKYCGKVHQYFPHAPTDRAQCECL